MIGEISVEGDTSKLEEIVKAVTAISEKIGRVRDDADEKSRKKQLIEYDKYFKEQERLAKDSYDRQARGFRQSHGENLKYLKKEAQEIHDLFASLYKAPAKFKPFKSANIAKDTLDQMGVDRLGDEMIEVASSIRKTMAESNKEVKKSTNLYKDFRRTMTGVLIDLHWLRILGSQSKVLSSVTDMLGKSMGYLLDVVLMPMIPAFISLTKYILGLAKWFSELPKGTRLIIAALATGAIVVTTFTTMLWTAYSALTAFTAALHGSAATTAGATVAGGVSVGGAASAGAAGIAGAGVGLGLGYLNEKWLGTGAKATWNRFALIQKMQGKNIPFMAEGGIATKPTAGIFGEGGAEAIIPLSKIGEVLGGILGSGAGFVNTLTQAASGALGAGAGGGLTHGGSVQSINVKGFSWVAGSINAGFKTTNELLAAILALLAQGGVGGGGLDPSKLVQGVIDAIVIAAKVAWDLILAMGKGVWDIILVTAKTTWDTTLEIANGVWNGILSIADNVFNSIFGVAEALFPGITDGAQKVWDDFKASSQSAWNAVKEKSDTVWSGIFAASDEMWDKIENKHLTFVEALIALLPGKQDITTGAGTTTGGGTSGGTKNGAIFEGLQKVFDSSGNYVGDWELYSDGSKKYRPNPNDTSQTGATAPPPGSGGDSAKQQNYLMSLARDPFVSSTDSMKEALDNSAGKATKTIETSTTSWTDVLTSGVSAFGHAIWNGLTGAAETVYNTVSGAVSSVVSTASSALSGISNYLSGTPGFRSPTTSTAMTGGFTAENAVNALGLGSGSLSTIVSRVAQGAATTLGSAAAHTLGIPGFASGGTMPHTGLAFLHQGETVIPASGGGGSSSITINNPTFQISGRTDRELFENFMRLMKIEGARVH